MYERIGGGGGEKALFITSLHGLNYILIVASEKRSIYNLRVMVAVVNIVYVYNTSRSIFRCTLLKIAQIATRH